MSWYAWTQDVPINAAMYGEITDRMGDAPMPGLVVHLAVENDDGTLHYIDVWRSETECDEAFEAVVHPAVHPVLMAHDVRPEGEPPRHPLKVIDVRLEHASVS